MQINNLIRKLTPPSKTEKVLIESLRLKIGKLQRNGGSSSPLSSWQANIADLREKILNKDPRFFLEWNTVQYTMVHECKPVELEYLRSLKNWPMWETSLIENSAGNPKSYASFKKSSGNLIHQAYSLSQLTERFHFDIKRAEIIFEFGGGYGSMARLMFQLGFKGQYIIFDLPEFSYLQEYYLNSAAIDARVYTEPTSQTGPSVVLISNLEKLASQINLSKQPDIFIALWSLSESPLSLRNKIINTVKDSKQYLIAYQHNFENIDNVSYFNGLGKMLENLDYVSYPITHLKGAHSYFVGAIK